MKDTPPSKNDQDETPSVANSCQSTATAKATLTVTPTSVSAAVKVNNSVAASNGEDNLSTEDTKSHDTSSCKKPAVAVAAVTNAATPGSSDDYTVAQAFQTIDTLTTVFQFPSELAHLAIEAVGPDAIAAYNWILDQNLAEDKGGPITPRSDCPHIKSHLKVTAKDLALESVCSHYMDSGPEKKGLSKGEVDEETGTCPKGENWLCLECNVTRCSRYVNGHAKQHWDITKKAALEDSSCDQVGDKVGHCIAVSLEDLSVWCYECSAYLNHPNLSPISQRLEELKFGNGREKADSPSNTQKVIEEKNNYYVDSGIYEQRKHPHLPKSMKELAEYILSDNCKSIIVLAGAGMSRASGIPDFRSAGGMYETLQPDLLTATEPEREAMKMDPTMVYEKGFFFQNSLPCLELQRPFIFGTKNRKWKVRLDTMPASSPQRNRFISNSCGRIILTFSPPLDLLAPSMYVPT